MPLFFVLLTILGIGFLIFIHEAGHYMMARLTGVRVLVFSLGFGPRLFGVVRGGTDYRVSAVPLGGYVRVAGEDPTDRRFASAGSLHSKGVPARALFFIGGVLMNLVFAFVAFPIVFKSGVDFPAPVIGEVDDGGPAWQAGLQPGDRVLEVNGKGMYSFDNMQIEVALVGVGTATLLVERDDRTFDVSVTPQYDPQLGLYKLGVSPSVEPEVNAVVRPGSPAHAAGLRDGDHLVAIDGVTLDRAALKKIELEARFMEDQVSVLAVRDGVERRHIFTPVVVDTPQAQIGVYRASRRVIGLRPGLDPLDQLGLAPGDHIVEVDGVRFGGGSLAKHAVGPGQLSMRVRRQGDDLITLEASFSAAERAALVNHVGFGQDTWQVAVSPMPGSPAEVAGLLDGDTITAIDGAPVSEWSQLHDAVRGAAPGNSLQLAVASGDGLVQRSITPAREASDLGLSFEMQKLTERYQVESVSGAISAGMVCSVDLIKSLYVTLKKLFTGEVAPSNLGGIITISRVTYLFAQSGWERFIYFLALLSINLAVINLLPIPVLDGGHLLFVAIEGIKGSPVSPRVHNYSQLLGLVFILLLLVYVTYNDIVRML